MKRKLDFTGTAKGDFSAAISGIEEISAGGYSNVRLLGDGERSASYQFAPDSRRAAMRHADDKLLSVLDVSTGERTLVMEAWDGRITHSLWAR